jgi:hypothetical protein
LENGLSPSTKSSIARSRFRCCPKKSATRFWKNPDLTATDDPDQTTVVDPDVSTQPPKPGGDPATDPAENPVDPPKPEENPVDPPKPEEKTVEPPAERPPEVPKVPFREFTKHLELPALENVQPIEIGKLAIQPSFLLGVDLFLSPEAARKTGIFELRRSDEDKQRWLVSKRKSKNSDPTDVAAFWKSDSAFHFQWLPAAQLDEDVNYLRNGALKLETPDGQNGWLSLRSPVTIEGFQLANEKGSAQVKLEIPWLPSPKGLIYQITPFADRTIPSICTSEFVQPKAPALMHFTTVPAEAFLWLEVSASQRKAIVLDAELKVKLGAIKPLNPAALSQYRQANLKMAANAAAAVKATKDKTAQQQYAAVQKTATQSAATFAKYETIIPKLQGKDIPLAIYLNVDKHHQLLIAKSPGFVGF